MKAAILAAGLGTRLRPLTDLVPKTLIPILNRPLLGLLLAQVEDAGFLQVAVNTHHLADAVATLVLHDCPPYNKVWVAEGRVVSIGAPPAGLWLEAAGPPLAYTGVQVVGPGMLKYLPAGLRRRTGAASRACTGRATASSTRVGCWGSSGW